MKDPQKDKKPPKGETPFGRFELLVKKVVSVPKKEIQKRNSHPLRAAPP
jgi:hypothetical protein